MRALTGALLLPAAWIVFRGVGASFCLFCALFLSMCWPGYLSMIGLPGRSGHLTPRLSSIPLILIWVGSFLSEGSCLLMKLTSAW